MGFYRAAWAMCVTTMMIVGAMPVNAAGLGAPATHDPGDGASWMAASHHDRAAFLPKRDGGGDVQELRPQSLPTSIIAWQVRGQYTNHRWARFTVDAAGGCDAGHTLLSLHCQLTV